MSSSLVDPNQGVIGGIEVPHVPVDLTARNAFGRVPFVEYFNIDPADFNEITPNDERMVGPEVLKPLLYKGNVKHTMRMPYPNGGWVVLSPDEFAIIPVSAGAFAERIGARNVASSEGLRKDYNIRAAASKRAGAHALESSVVPKLRNLTDAYTAKIEDLKWLQKEIPVHYHAHSNEAKMRLVAQTALEAFRQTIETIGASQDWDGDRIEVSKLAVQKRLLAGRGGGTLEPKKAYWMDMIAVSGNHTNAKRGLVRARMSEANNIIDRYLR